MASTCVPGTPSCGIWCARGNFGRGKSLQHYLHVCDLRMARKSAETRISNQDFEFASLLSNAGCVEKQTKQVNNSLSSCRMCTKRRGGACIKIVFALFNLQCNCVVQLEKGSDVFTLFRSKFSSPNALAEPGAEIAVSSFDIKAGGRCTSTGHVSVTTVSASAQVAQVKQKILGIPE